jgi:hypothetical protein
MNIPRRSLGLLKQILLTLLFAAVVSVVKLQAWTWNVTPLQAAQLLLGGAIGIWLIPFALGMTFHLFKEFLTKTSGGMTYFWVATFVLVLFLVPWPKQS